MNIVGISYRRTVTGFACILSFVICILACGKREGSHAEGLKIAFMADVHLHDIHGTFSDTGYRGVQNPVTGKYNTIRTMGAQLRSTRLFNENYFAFKAALDDAAKRGVSYVVLPGDFSDDGQPLNVRAVRKLLDFYTQQHDISFFAITGNHDPVRPFAMPSGKLDFLGEAGQEQAIVSQLDLAPQNNSTQLPPIVTAEIQNMGYEGILAELKNFGFSPSVDYHYWETPFSEYDLDTYTYNKALESAILENRMYTVYSGIALPDASYLVEPVEGLWLLALDGNVYIPKKELAEEPSSPNYYGSASIGYNQVLTHKKHLIPWVKKTMALAKTQGKMVIAFSHYPMIDFNDDTSLELSEVFGKNTFQLHRVPQESVAQGFAEAGLKIHFGGHMHINDTGVRTTKLGNTLVNVQVPSLAAYSPAYKIATIKTKNEIEVETIRMDSVQNYKELFPLYEMEHAYLTNTSTQNIWNSNILLSETYRDFTQWHLRELVRLRFLPQDWPDRFINELLSLSGAELFAVSQMDSGTFTQNAALDLDDLSQTLTEVMKENQSLPWDQLQSWKVFDLVFDFYKVRNADELALADIDQDRLQQYVLVLNAFQANESQGPQKWMGNLGRIFGKMLNGKPSDHFMIDMENGQVIQLNEERPRDFKPDISLN
ncbi:metallophosphoesterase [Flagellimonas algicola]|uniref:Metallophosphoesterase n=1 Tax=Flagellimonas algicola TaxID=2583815 RepID=A0ABY2WPQ8_9FLAO|nr:metallophosphoesterase [Allomuricauda algicola]TMU56737.1 metallophosphoesterase [Allomuricauda algicola]